MNLKKRKKSQAWSFDVMIAVIVFLGVFFIFYSLLKSPAEDTVDALKNCAELIAGELPSESSAINIIEGGEINETKLQDLVDEAYLTLKQKVRAGCDFCIHLEDQMGNVIYVRSTIDENVTGIGTPNVKLTDIPCS